MNQENDHPAQDVSAVEADFHSIVEASIGLSVKALRWLPSVGRVAPRLQSIVPESGWSLL